MLYKKRIEKKVLFGKIVQVHHSYVSADIQPPNIIFPNYAEYFSKVNDIDAIIANADATHLVWNDEPSIFWLAVAMIVYQTNSVFVPVYGWVFWNYSIGFYGSGYEYFQAK